MYANMKQTPANTEAHVIIKTNLKTYNKIRRHSIAQAKTIYYQQKLTKYTNDIRNTSVEKITPAAFACSVAWAAAAI